MIEILHTVRIIQYDDVACRNIFSGNSPTKTFYKWFGKGYGNEDRQGSPED